MFDIDNVNIVRNSPIDSGIDIVDYFFVVFSNVVLNVDYCQRFFFHFHTCLAELPFILEKV